MIFFYFRLNSFSMYAARFDCLSAAASVYILSENSSAILNKLIALGTFLLKADRKVRAGARRRKQSLGAGIVAQALAR
jgi:hypothetical protein